jgi:hypothetical protein
LLADPCHIALDLQAWTIDGDRLCIWLQLGHSLKIRSIWRFVRWVARPTTAPPEPPRRPEPLLSIGWSRTTFSGHLCADLNPDIGMRGLEPDCADSTQSLRGAALAYGLDARLEPVEDLQGAVVSGG